MIPPCRPGWRVSRSHLRAWYQSLAAVLRDIAANRTGLVTLPRQTGQGARVRGKLGRTAEIESTGSLRGWHATRPEAAPPGHTSPVARIRACFNGAVQG